MIGRIQKHARERLNFAGEVDTAQRLAACKTFLRLESAMIRMHHDAGATGLETAHARAAMVDILLGHLFDYAMAAYVKKHDEVPSPVALIALGGYGRSELSPLSDIDVLFLFPSKAKTGAIKPLQEHLSNEILYILWDCGLKVGHATRTVDETFVEARADIQTKTALLEARLVAGSAALFESFSSAYRAFYTEENPRGYIAARLADQVSRRAKYGDTVFLQEPDIKNGVGGLRDYQNTLWMARVKLGITSLDELATQAYLRQNEVRDFQRAYTFLHRVRNELHFQSKRPTDVLALDVQPKIALGLGYTNRDLLGRVEQFMRDYYRAAQTIHRISRLIESRLALTLETPNGALMSFREAIRAKRFEKTKRIDGFILRGGELAAESPEVFKADPARIIRVFRHCQQLGAKPDFALQGQIRDAVPLLTRHVQQSRDANISFRSILQQSGAVYPTLSLMHELGVLGRFIPEFDALTCLVQHEFYHRYTADIHTLHAIRELDFIFTDAEPVSLKYRSTLHETPEPTLLYLILLLHDIGKARGIKGHADSGVAIAGPLLDRMEIDATSREFVVFVIKNHLVMTRFWQKRDVDDPGTAAAFAEIVGDADRLRYLYVHTFCDARGTAAGLWNGYKDTLHTALYRATLERLLHGAELARRNSQRLEATYQELIRKSIPGIGPDEISAHFHLLPERYFMHTETSKVALHIQMVNRLLQSIADVESTGTLRPVIDWKDDLNRSFTVVNVVTWDRAGLFYKLAGAFSVAGLSILGAKVISRSDNIAIDTFFVVEPGRGVVQNAAAQETFARTVEAALVMDKDLLPDIETQARKLASTTRYLSSAKKGNDAMQNSFPPIAEVYHESSMQRTIVEIQARDEIGLLFRLGKTISDHGFDITFARVGTEHSVAIDTFYIENANHSPATDPARLDALREALALVIAPRVAEINATPVVQSR
ncbi:MAG: [protein-PII] uridylyltransferase [Opitutaceae bacterium]|nr:[protein-PII] uridylyltransferase [Opitutaceae bacterium]